MDCKASKNTELHTRANARGALQALLGSGADEALQPLVSAARRGAAHRGGAEGKGQRRPGGGE